MTGASKILTVSYGTFSCTLEGFDDPFNTMKAIAEYFRDLAAEDRYFGAEPPVPDAAMLHRIAEREIHRRVEAKIQDNGVILRAGDADEAPALADLPRPVVAEAPLMADTTSESVAARLQRIRAKHTAAPEVIAAPVAEAQPATAAVPVAVAAPVPALTTAIEPTLADEYIEDEHAGETGLADLEDIRATDAPPANAPDQIEVPDQIVQILDEAENAHPVIDLTDQFADLPEAEDFVSQPDIADADADADAAILAGLQSDLPEDIAAATQDAGETVDLPEEFDTASVDFSDLEDEDGDAFLDDMLDDADDLLSDADSAADAGDLGLDDALLSRLSDADVTAAADDTAMADADHSASVDASAPVVSDDDMLARISGVVDGPVIDPVDQSDVDQQDEADPQPVVAAPRARARVIRIRRADPVAAEEPAPQLAENSALSDEAEAALQAELAALEAEINGDVAPAPVAPAAVAAAPSVKAAEPRRSVQTPAEDEAVNRLMDHANLEMGGEDTRRRQSAIAHLKAAVAATEADRMVSGGQAPRAEERLEAYRSDLDRVVRPRRPVTEAAAQRTAPVAPAPAQPQSRPTPLVLVSAQRIDRTPDETSAPRVVMPVRPRRVAVSPTSAPDNAERPPMTAAPVMQDVDQTDLDDDDILLPDEAENVFADATSFEDFADQLGAAQLSDLLEAAAVYCAEVLQRPEFSRPLVMRQIASLPGHTSATREDYLRGFGTLLRQGRIAKVKRGMFALTDRSPYLAEARKIAG